MPTTNLLMKTPYILRIERVKQENYALGLAEGEAKGKAEGEAKGQAEGKAKGLEEGQKFIRDNISDILYHRFEPRLKEFEAMQEKLQALKSYTALGIASQKAALVRSFTDFVGWLVEATDES